MGATKVIEDLKKLISEKQQLSDNKCGTTIMYLMDKLNLNSDEISEMLNELHSQKFIVVRTGINNKLIFLKTLVITLIII